jgi:hypothetical protein
VVTLTKNCILSSRRHRRVAVFSLHISSNCLPHFKLPPVLVVTENSIYIYQ